MTNNRTATFGAGCFWGVEAAFRQVEGVLATAVGYAGGATMHPTYEQVCTGRTGHAEVVQVDYDAHQVGYDELLRVFWASHDATQIGGQGLDIGTQYRSVIFVHDEVQRQLADESRRRLVLSGRAIATLVQPAATFWRAEEYHQQYLEKRGRSACRIG